MKVIGMDISEDMLKLARRRAKNAGVTVDFILRDMRNFTLIEKVDLVVSLYDSLNYLLTPSDLEDCFECVFDSLRDNGLFIFDMNTRRTLRNWNSWRYFNESSNTGLVGSFNSKTNLAKLKAVLFVKRKNGNYKRLTEVHEERAYANREIKDALRKAGFPEIRAFSFPEVERKTSRDGVEITNGITPGHKKFNENTQLISIYTTMTTSITER